MEAWGSDLTSQPRPSPCAQRLAQQQACALSLASEMPGLFLAQVGSSFSAEAAELEDVNCVALSLLPEEEASREEGRAERWGEKESWRHL